MLNIKHDHKGYVYIPEEDSDEDNVVVSFGLVTESSFTKRVNRPTQSCHEVISKSSSTHTSRDA